MHLQHSKRLRRVDWRPDHPDHRDYKFHDHFKIAPAALPRMVDLRPKSAPIWDQGNFGCCTGFGNARVHAFLHGDVESSPMFIYYMERLANGDVKTDDGAEIRDGQNVLRKFGAPLEADWKYGSKWSQFVKKPTAAVMKLAAARKVTSNFRIDGTKTPVGDGLRQCLADGFPVVFGFTCYEQIEQALVAETGILPDPSGKDVGGHCVTQEGYGEYGDFVKDARALKRAGVHEGDECYLIAQSWGLGFGLKGYMLMSRKYVESEDLSSDFWTARA